jgi:hypothetical protein
MQSSAPCKTTAAVLGLPAAGELTGPLRLLALALKASTILFIAISRVETMLKVGGAISISDQYGTKHSVLQAHCCGNTGWLDSAPGLRALDSNLAMPRQLD